MKTYKCRCLGCGEPVEFVCYETSDLFVKDLHEDDLGWWDHECGNCYWCTSEDMVEARASGTLDGYCCDLESADQVMLFIEILLEEHPELFEKEDLDE